MAQNVLLTYADNKVKFVFAGVDLTVADDVRVDFGFGSHKESDGDGIVTVVSATELTFKPDTVFTEGGEFPSVYIYDAESTANGKLIAGKSLGNIEIILVDGVSSLAVETGDTDYDNVKPNTYASIFDYVLYCQRNGLPFGNTSTEQEFEILTAMRYMAKFERDYQGYRSNSDQTLPFPRTGVYLNGYLVAADEIPQQLKDSLFEIASFGNQNELFNSGKTASQQIQKKKIEGLEISYFEGHGSGRVNPRAGMDLLEAFFEDSNCLERT